LILQALEDDMADYLSTFAVGFEELAASLITRRLPGASIINLWGGMAQYRYSGPQKLVEKQLPFVHNTYALLKVCKGKNMTFEHMVSEAQGQRFRYQLGQDSFRVRFSNENVFERVPPSVMNMAEQLVKRATHMQVSRNDACTELWYIIRSEGIGFYAQLLFSRPDRSAAGNLRPELAYLLCVLAETDNDSVVLDSFCGSGILIKSLRDYLPYAMLYASDADRNAIARLTQEPLLQKNQGSVHLADARELPYLADNSIDAVVTDPPWGDYTPLTDVRQFYMETLSCLYRVLKPTGRVVLLTARKQELISAAHATGFVINNTFHTLVNGKKSAAFVMMPRTQNDMS
jgi:23S rRNA G2445 N2-methylase RlmL